VSLDAPAAEREKPLSASLPDPRALDPERETMARERQRALHQALLGLRRPYREAVILRDVEGLSYEEIAAALEISIGTVKSRLSRGRLELRRMLEGSLT
jgi:RNA polymerase sigma-70 factor, ECF subfamily